MTLAFSFTNAAGVSLRFLEETLPSDSIVDFDDTLNIGLGPAPTNRNPGSAGSALECITDLVDCCSTPRAEHGDWYFPGGTTAIGFGSHGAQFLVNRGPYENINGQQFNGSVRLFRRFSAVPQRGRFRCELPSAADPNTDLTLYVNICEFVTSLVCSYHYNIIIIFFHSELWVPF